MMTHSATVGRDGTAGRKEEYPCHKRRGIGHAVVTLNTWGIRGDRAARLPVFQQEFQVLDADVVILQETILTGSVDQAAQY